MTARTLVLPRPLQLREFPLALGGVLAVAAAGSVTAGWLLVNGQVDVRALPVAAAGVGIVGLGFVAPERLLLAVVVWLAALGFLRRVVTHYEGGVGSDPLLLVGPLALVLVALVAVHRGALRDPTRLSKAVAVLAALTLAGAVNPLQGNIAAGVVSLLFVFVPMLGFWIGRAIDDVTLHLVFKFVAAVSAIVAVYGFVQTLHGFPSWDARWIAEQSDEYAALGVFSSGGESVATRPFGTFSSAAEYSHFLAIGLALFATGVILRRRLFLRALLVAFMLVAIVLASARGVLVVTVVGVLLCLAAWRRHRLSAALVGAAAIVLSLPFALGALHFGEVGSGPVVALVGHQVEGLRDPLNPATSTLPAHVSIVRDGLELAFSNPLGLGLSAVTIAGERLGTTVSAGTEADVGNMAVALGVPGLLAYIVVVVLGLNTVYRVGVRRRDATALACIGISFIMIFQWLNGGLYSVAWLPWLVLGWADRRGRAQPSK